jgi:hypothetical protein
MWRVIAAVTAAAALLPGTAAAQETTKHAGFGESIVLRGQSGEQIRVRPYRLEEIPEQEFEEPAAGKRFVGVWVQFRNVGRRGWSSFIGNGAQLITTRGRAIDATVMVEGPCETGQLRVPRGQMRRACIPFEVGFGARLRYFEFNLASGFADETGQWRRLPTP